jgi:hypothetical protein
VETREFNGNAAHFGSSSNVRKSTSNIGGSSTYKTPYQGAILHQNVIRQQYIPEDD